MNPHMPAAPAASLAVQMTGISKRFGPVLANDQVDLNVPAGSIHALVGENGAGKSTLMSILYGFYAADAGQICLHGEPVRLRHAQDAIARGVGMVHQHFMLAGRMSALENVMLGAEPSRWLKSAAAQARARLQALMQSTGLQVALDQVVDDLSVGDCQRLEILKALFRGARILILDEPTAVLTPQETQQLFEVLTRLRAQGTTILIITHKLKEVMQLCDGVTVMRGGRVVLNTTVRETSIEALAQAMVGRSVHLGAGPRAAHTPGPVLLEVLGLRVTDAWGVARLDAVDLALRGGEIVGVAGVSGNGQSELLDVLSGLCVPDRGSLSLQGHRFAPPAWLDPIQARDLGLAHVPEDRYARALVMDFVAWEGAVLGYEALPDYSSRIGQMHHPAMRRATAGMMSAFDVRPPHPALRCGQFSGGNQQKLVLARELGQQPRVLLIGQPTRGVDIGAIEFIHARIRQMRDAGCAVLLVSSELDEILALADRVVVMNQGMVTGELPVSECNETQLGLLMAGGAQAQGIHP